MNKNNKNFVVVVGSGGIANRHIKNIKKIYKKLIIIRVSSTGRNLSKKEIGNNLFYRDLKKAIELNPIWAIVASPAISHIKHIQLFNRKNIPVLVEKPLTTTEAELKKYNLKKNIIYVGYNLRFLDSTQYISKIINKNLFGKILNVQIDVGHYLPNWRSIDYKKSVSAQAKLGGGALLELSHEIDYVNFLFGKIRLVTCIKSKVSKLKIDVEDNVNALLINQDGLNISLHLDFLQRKANRQCKIICENGNIYWNLKNNTVTLEDNKTSKKIIFKSHETVSKSYVKQLKSFDKIFSSQKNLLATFNDGLDVIKIIDAMNISNKKRKEIKIN